MSRATIDTNKDALKKQMDDRKAALEMIDWDGNTPPNSPTTSIPNSIKPPLSTPRTTTRTLSLGDNSKVDSECPKPIPGCQAIKVNTSDITRLRHDLSITKYNNWLSDLKSAFDITPARFPNSRNKIVFATLAFNNQLKTTYNTTNQAHPTIMTH